MARISKLLKELQLQSISTKIWFNIESIIYTLLWKKQDRYREGVEWVVKRMKQGYFNAEDAADTILQ